ncbi:MAG: hypothetical protein ACOZQL_02410 [Myxococcota bacterium]
MSELCNIWRDLVKNPNNPSAASRAQERAEDLFDHIEECPACFGAAETSRIEDVYLALAGSESPDTDDMEMLKAMLQAKASDEESVIRAVTEVLLPSLGRELENLNRLGQDLSPLKLFLALEGFSMLAHRVLRKRPADTVFSLERSGALSTREGEVASVETVVSELAQAAGIGATSAKKILLNWLPKALVKVPRLVPGIESAIARDHVELRLSARNPDEDLGQRWLARN